MENKNIKKKNKRKHKRRAQSFSASQAAEAEAEELAKSDFDFGWQMIARGEWMQAGLLELDGWMDDLPGEAHASSAAHQRQRLKFHIFFCRFAGILSAQPMCPRATLCARLRLNDFKNT